LCFFIAVNNGTHDPSAPFTHAENLDCRMSIEQIGLSIVIPTYGREQVLLDSIASLTSLDVQADEIILVDQTRDHLPEIIQQLRAWHETQLIIWIQMERPSITAAMNRGLKTAKSPLVLFLDDDIIAKPGLVANHARVHESDRDCWATVGQVMQPWQKPENLAPPRKLIGLKTDFDFPFNSTQDAELHNVMAGNLCVNRERALSIGGFDENFIGAAFRFETDFARRVIAAGGRINFVGSAGIHHLRTETGGTRSKGNHMASASPLHGFGDYYYAFRHADAWDAWMYSFQRLFREVRTRFHLTHPWWIPVKLVGEARAILMARKAVKSGRKLIGQGTIA
jgi:GT2 family glycosyltransferase